MNQDHKHEPIGEVETYPYAKIGKCACGVDMVSYAANTSTHFGTAPYGWKEWEVTAIDDPCLSCGGFDTPSCCEVESVEKSYKVTFITDYFIVATMINAHDEEQAERLAEEWLDENGLQISKFKVLDIETEWEGIFND